MVFGNVSRPDFVSQRFVRTRARSLDDGVAMSGWGGGRRRQDGDPRRTSSQHAANNAVLHARFTRIVCVPCCFANGPVTTKGWSLAVREITYVSGRIARNNDDNYDGSLDPHEPRSTRYNHAHRRYIIHTARDVRIRW